MRRIYFDLCTAMLRTGLLGYGGGPSTVPLIRFEAVTRYRWMTDEEFGDVLAIANALPGPIATKLAAYLGYRLKGTAGAIAGIAAHIFPSCLAMIVLVEFIQAFSSSAFIHGMIAAVVPVVSVMLAQMTYEFAVKAAAGLGKKWAIVLGVIVFALLQWFQLHPAIVIALFLGYGALHFKTISHFKKTKGKVRKEEAV
ncbi:chromate transporter [Paenibacillus chartarius]|uniref:Chromate transporter n=1 Tax=Paenibacillus chartarius TaxID=747481 RepID=A0ABV6DGZ7_9BACL